MFRARRESRQPPSIWVASTYPSKRTKSFDTESGGCCLWWRSARPSSLTSGNSTTSTAAPRDPDLDDLRRAAKEIAKFEERAIYDGFPEGSIRGLIESSDFDPIAVKLEAGSLLDAVGKAVMRLRYADVDGPYVLALGAALHQWLDSGCEQAYPLRKRLLQLIDGPIVPAPFLDGGVVLSRRGGDAEMTLGQDISIGYEHHDARKVHLFFSESFTFRVLAPEAVVALATAAAK